MLDDIGGVTSQLVRVALDAAIVRHKVIANNIANANTPGYAPNKLTFDAYLLNELNLDAVRSADSKETLKNELENISERLAQGSFVEKSNEPKVELDVEMANMAENVIRYKALLEGISKRGAIINMAISQQGGR